MWGGISCRGASKLVVFIGKLNATRLIKIYEASLVPFIKSTYPEGHRLMQDNDPKHNSKLARAYLIENGIHWWETPPESPNLNPIENVWGSMKTFLRDKVKPTDMALLLDGINNSSN